MYLGTFLVQNLTNWLGFTVLGSLDKCKLDYSDLMK